MNAIATVQTRVQAIQRGMLDAGFTLARLPLSAVERVAGQRGNEEWPPAVAFEGLEAQVETLLGSLLRDDTLGARGRLRQAKVAELRKAMTLETIAEQERHEGRQAQRERLDRASARRERAEKSAEQRLEMVETAAERRDREAREKERTKVAAARRAKAKQDKAVDRVERATRAKALDEEAAALDAERRALEAEQAVASLDDAIERSKSRRKTG